MTERSVDLTPRWRWPATAQTGSSGRATSAFARLARLPLGKGRGQQRQASRPPAIAGFELLFLALLIGTIGALALEDRILVRTERVHPAPTHLLRAHSDSELRGTSTMQPDGRPSSWRCSLRGQNPYPFCGVELLFDPKRPEKGLDLSRTDSIRIAYSYEGAGETLRLNLRNYDARYSKPGVPSSTKFNTIEFKAKQGEAVAELAMADISVAGWWMTENRIAPEFGRPEFSNVVGLQVLTGTGTPLGRHRIAIDEIVLHGRLLTHAEWYLLLLGIWGASIALFLIWRVVGATAALRTEVQAREKAEQRAQTLARNDALTGFLNRHAFREELATRLGQGGDTEAGAVFLIEIGNLRSVNDVHGHSAGDDLMIETARRLDGLGGDTAIAGRMGGNELAFFVPEDHASQEDLAALTMRLNQAFACGGNSLNPGATIGVARYPEHGGDYTTLFRAADIALHEARRTGGGTFRFYNPGLEGGASQRIARIRGRERVLRAGEALPAFVAQARTDIVIREACRIASAWPSETALRMKLSPAEWREDWTAERIITQIDMRGLTRMNFIVEIAESIYLGRVGATMRNLQTLQREGMRLALTEFRNGFDPSTSAIKFAQIEIDAGYLGSSLGAGERKMIERRA